MNRRIVWIRWQKVSKLWKLAEPGMADCVCVHLEFGAVRGVMFIRVVCRIDR